LLAFTRRLIRLRLEHPVFRRRRFLTGVEATELRWYTPAGTEMTNADWANTGAHSVAVYLDGADDPDRAADGTPLLDDDFLVLVNAWWEPLDFAVASTPAPAWRPEIDTYERSGLPAAANVQAGETVTVRPRSIVVLCGSRN
jgi:isoamylase